MSKATDGTLNRSASYASGGTNTEELTELLTELENAVEHTTIARLNGKTTNNRMIHAEFMTKFSDLLDEQTRLARIAENNEWLRAIETNHPLFKEMFEDRIKDLAALERSA